jgi:WD40-like Beta Propeller Repeat
MRRALVALAVCSALAHTLAQQTDRQYPYPPVRDQRGVLPPFPQVPPYPSPPFGEVRSSSTPTSSDAFVRWSSPGDCRIPASGKTSRLTNDTHPRALALWSPDGKYIYYPSFRDGDSPIYRLPSDGSGREELVFRYTPGAFVALTDISADGKFLVCDSGGVILVVPLTGSDAASRKEIEYLREEFTDGVARLSPDGKFMAYRSDEAQPERGEVYVRPFDASTGKPGGGKWQVSKDGVNAMVHWRADGKEIFFRGQNLESNELQVMSVDVATTPTFSTGTPKLLFKLPGPLAGNIGNISRDGQRFVFAVNVSANVSSESK